MQTKISGHKVNYTDLTVPYKLGDCMYLKNESKNNKDEKNLEEKMSSVNLGKKESDKEMSKKKT